MHYNRIIWRRLFQRNSLRIVLTFNVCVPYDGLDTLIRPTLVLLVMTRCQKHHNLPMSITQPLKCTSNQFFLIGNWITQAEKANTAHTIHHQYQNVNYLVVFLFSIYNIQLWSKQRTKNIRHMQQIANKNDDIYFCFSKRQNKSPAA